MSEHDEWTQVYDALVKAMDDEELLDLSAMAKFGSLLSPEARANGRRMVREELGHTLFAVRMMMEMTDA